MKTVLKAGDVVKANVKYLEEVLNELQSPTPTQVQTTQALGLLRDQTATVIDVNFISIEGTLWRAIHIMPTVTTNSLYRGGRGSKIYFETDADITNCLLKIN